MYVQGESLKTGAALLVRLLNSPAPEGRRLVIKQLLTAGAVIALATVGATATTVEQSDLTPDQTAAVMKGVGSKLLDPDSARYRLPALISSGQTVQAYCGCVNSKNSYGGYTGQKPFYGAMLQKDGKTAFLMISEADAPAGVDSGMCTKAGYSLDC